MIDWLKLPIFTKFYINAEKLTETIAFIVVCVPGKKYVTVLKFLGVSDPEVI